MKTENGITLMSVIIYVIVLFIVLGILATITANFESNVGQLYNDENSATEIDKFNMYFLQEIKKQGNGIDNISEDEKKITFLSGIQYSYEESEKKIYLIEGNKEIDISNNISNCQFESKLENGKEIVVVTIQYLNNPEKEIEYVFANRENEDKYENEDDYTSTANNIVNESNNELENSL